MRTILVVDDPSPQRQAIVTNLSRAGFIVLHAADRDATLSVLHAYSQRVDLLLVNAQLRAREVDRLVRDVRAERHGIRVLLVGDEPRGLADASLAKTFQFDEMIQQIWALIDQRKVDRRAEPPLGVGTLLRERRQKNRRSDESSAPELRQ